MGFDKPRFRPASRAGAIWGTSPGKENKMKEMIIDRLVGLCLFVVICVAGYVYHTYALDRARIEGEVKMAKTIGRQLQGNILTHKLGSELVAEAVRGEAMLRSVQ